MYVVAEADHPVTVRQVFYRLVSAGAIDKSEGEYKSTVVRLLTEMRLAGDLTYGWIADNTRWMRKPTTWNSVEDLLAHTAKTVRGAVEFIANGFDTAAPETVRNATAEYRRSQDTMARFIDETLEF